MYLNNLGWKRDLPDFRDRKYAYEYAAQELPDIIDMRSQMTAVYDQGNLGSCTAQAIAAALEWEWKENRKTDSFLPSRLFLYYNERVLENTIDIDAGAMLRTGMKVINKFGFCDENYWPYEISVFRKKPHDIAYDKADDNIVYNYARVTQSRKALRATLAQNQPIVCGFAVYSSIENAEKDGHIKMPKWYETMCGGHAILLCGYNDETKEYLFRNSWGEKWGHEGYGYLPYDYIEDPDLAGDFWAIWTV